jgi:thiamine kinase-like enzyme
MQPAELERIAARTVPGSGPVEISRLGSGSVNASYRVGRAGRLHVLRIAGTGPLQALDRAWEARVLEVASAAGVAPKIEYSDPLAGILVARWVDGRSWSPAEARSRENSARIASLVRRIQAQPLPAAPRIMSPAAWIDQYASRGCASEQLLRARADALLAALAGFPAAAGVLCHSDLHRMNLIDGDASLVALDWEYSHVSDPLWDLAGWSSNNDLEPDLRHELLTGYLGRAPHAPEWARLQVLAGLYDYLCLLWSELYLRQSPGGADPAVPARMQLLEARLGAVVEQPKFRHTNTPKMEE